MGPEGEDMAMDRELDKRAVRFVRHSMVLNALSKADQAFLRELDELTDEAEKERINRLMLEQKNARGHQYTWLRILLGLCIYFMIPGVILLLCVHSAELLTKYRGPTETWYYIAGAAALSLGLAVFFVLTRKKITWFSGLAYGFWAIGIGTVFVVILELKGAPQIIMACLMIAWLIAALAAFVLNFKKLANWVVIAIPIVLSIAFAVLIRKALADVFYGNMTADTWIYISIIAVAIVGSIAFAISKDVKRKRIRAKMTAEAEGTVTYIYEEKYRDREGDERTRYKANIGYEAEGAAYETSCEIQLFGLKKYYGYRRVVGMPLKVIYEPGNPANAFAENIKYYKKEDCFRQIERRKGKKNIA